MKRMLLVVITLGSLFTGIVYVHHRIVTSITHAGCVDIPATPDYLSSNSAQDAIAALNNAHKLSNLPPVQLPGNFYQLDPAQQQFMLLNIERTDRHLRPLRWDANLAQMALGYSKQLRDLHFFAHTSPIAGTFSERVNGNAAIANHYSVAAENLASNPVAGIGPIYEYLYDDSNEACGHRHNILNPALTTVGINWVRGGPYGSISAQEFIASATWNPYMPVQPISVAPGLSIAVNAYTGSTLLRCQASVSDPTTVERITWFLDRVSNTPAQVGSAWTLDTATLAPGQHTLIVYAVDGEQNYSMATYTIRL